MCAKCDNSNRFSCDEIREPLNEMLYKDLMREILPNSVAGATNNKLPYRDWSPLIPSVQYRGYKKDTFKFFVPNKYNGWETYVKFDDWEEQVYDLSINAVEAARLLLWGGNIRLHCGCPAFSFYGFEYILTQLDASINTENRFPKKMNPQLKGVVCKHLLKTLKVLPFQLGPISAAIKETRSRI